MISLESQLRKQMSVSQAYACMLKFLEDYYNRAPSDELAMLLGDLSLCSPTQSMDPAAIHDWLQAVEHVLSNPSVLVLTESEEALEDALENGSENVKQTVP
jgi:hypothetical protein